MIWSNDAFCEAVCLTVTEGVIILESASFNSKQVPGHLSFQKRLLLNTGIPGCLHTFLPGSSVQSVYIISYLSKLMIPEVVKHHRKAPTRDWSYSLVRERPWAPSWTWEESWWNISRHGLLPCQDINSRWMQQVHGEPPNVSGSSYLLVNLKDCPPTSFFFLTALWNFVGHCRIFDN